VELDTEKKGLLLLNVQQLMSCYAAVQLLAGSVFCWTPSLWYVRRYAQSKAV
jgi:hypothetical protein